MFRLLYKVLAFISKKRAWNLKIGSTIWVYFPNVDRYFRMTVSNKNFCRFTARFESDEDWDLSKVEEDYGQIDNDILFDKETMLPKNLKKFN